MYSDMSMRTIAPLVVEQERRERLGELGLADAGRAEEHERADRPVGVLQPRASAADRGRNRVHRLALADDPPHDFLLHLEELLAFAFEHLVDRDAGPARDDLGDVVGGDRFVDERALALFLALGELLFEFGDRAVGDLAGLGEVAPALRLGKRVARRVELFLELLDEPDLILLRPPASGERVRLLLQFGEFGGELLEALLGGRRRSPSSAPPARS